MTRNELHKSAQVMLRLTRSDAGSAAFLSDAAFRETANDARLSFGFPASRAASAIRSDDADYLDVAFNRYFTPQRRRSLS